MRDNVNGIKVLNPVRFADNNAATVAEVAVDLQGFNGACFAIDVGTMTGTGTFTPVMKESDDGSTWTAVPAAKIVGDAPVALVTDTPQKFGYNGTPKRYIALEVVKAGTVSAAEFGVTAILSRADSEPVAAG